MRDVLRLSLSPCFGLLVWEGYLNSALSDPQQYHSCVPLLIRVSTEFYSLTTIPHWRFLHHVGQFHPLDWIHLTCVIETILFKARISINLLIEDLVCWLKHLKSFSHRAAHFKLQFKTITSWPIDISDLRCNYDYKIIQALIRDA